MIRFYVVMAWCAYALGILMGFRDAHAQQSAAYALATFFFSAAIYTLLKEQRR